MTPELQILLASASIVCAAMLGYQAGWRVRGAQPRRDYSSAAIARLVWQQHRRGSNPPPPGGKPALSVTRAAAVVPVSALRAGGAGGGVTWRKSPVQRGNGTGGSSTTKPNIIPKPQPSGGRLIGPNGAPVGYRPNPSRPGANPPPRNP
jgi:hypothetical protein